MSARTASTPRLASSAAIERAVSINGVQLDIIALQLATLFVPECAQMLHERSIIRGPPVDW